jgi:hypothetical protein
VGCATESNFTVSSDYYHPVSIFERQRELQFHFDIRLTIIRISEADELVGRLQSHLHAVYRQRRPLITEGTVRIIAPDGIFLSNLKLPAQSPVTLPFDVSGDYRTIKVRGVTNFNNLTFSLTFNYLPFWSALEILPWIFLLEIAVFAVVIVGKYRRGPSISVPIPVERLREFVGLYDERLALSRELLAMEEDVNRGGMVKHEFRRRSKVIELRLGEINKSLMAVKTELRVISPHYDELIRRIDRAEAEAAGSRASASQVRSQYRSGKITREAYETVTNDIARRIDRAEETVETILITLREEAR